MMLAWILACQQGEKIVDSATEVSEIIPAQSARMYRLTHSQWNHAIDDLLGLDGTQYSENFIGETLGSGFDNDADTLVVSSLLFQDYQRAAEGLARKVAGEDVDGRAAKARAGVRQVGWASDLKGQMCARVQRA